MQSIGNDIVDLSLIDAEKSKNRRFYAKILSPSEVQLHEDVSGKILFEHFVWLCWTIKEATYKFSKRLHPHLLFSPPRTVIEHIYVLRDYADPFIYHGSCSNGLSVVNFETTFLHGYIHTIASSPLISNVESKIVNVDALNASAEVHAHLLTSARKIYSNDDIDLHKDADNIPSLVVNGDFVPVSVSHHGSYGAFALYTP